MAHLIKAADLTAVHLNKTVTAKSDGATVTGTLNAVKQQLMKTTTPPTVKTTLTIGEIGLYLGNNTTVEVW
jgi:hypothetical protein